MTNVNFRRSLDVCFLVTAIVSVCACCFMLYLQWTDTRSDYRQQAERYVHSQASLINNYLLFDENILIESANQMSVDEGFAALKTGADSRLSQWFIGHLLTTPDVLSIVYADSDGSFVHFPLTDTSKEIGKDYPPQESPWFLNVVENDSHSVYYSSDIDHFNNNYRVLTLSIPVISSRDGSKNGALAFHLNPDFGKQVLKSISGPFAGSSSMVMNTAGELVLSMGNEVSPKTLELLAKKTISDNGAFYIDGDWYTYTATRSNWIIIYKVADSVLTKYILSKCSYLFWVCFFSLASLLSCWWMLHVTMNNIYLHIATGVRNGVIEQKGADQILYDEIHNSIKQKKNIENKMLTDSLTGLKNRRAFDNDMTLLDNETECCIALLDIDNFKFINDTFGHAVGDTVLKIVADIGLRLRGLNDIKIYRYGGEEVAVLFSGMTSGEAFRFLNLWRESVREREYREGDLHVTFSGGLCIKKNMSITDALKLADEALYKAKSNGKNQIIIV